MEELEKRIAELERENEILRANARAQGLAEEIGATGKTRRKELAKMTRVIHNQRADLRRVNTRLMDEREAFDRLQDAAIAAANGWGRALDWLARANEVVAMPRPMRDGLLSDACADLDRARRTIKEQSSVVDA